MALQPAALNRTQTPPREHSVAEARQCMDEYLRAIQFSASLRNRIITEALCEAALKIHGDHAHFVETAFNCLLEHPRVTRSLQQSVRPLLTPEFTRAPMVPQTFEFSRTRTAAFRAAWEYLRQLIRPKPRVTSTAA